MALRVLLIGRGEEPTLSAWRAQLVREGVPFDEHITSRDGPLTEALLGDGVMDAYYNAVVVAVDGPSLETAVLSRPERAVLERFERQFDVRRVTAYVVPSLAVGLHDPLYVGRMQGVTGTVTRAGQDVFGYLVGEFPVDPAASGYLSLPASDTFRVLVEGSGASALIGVWTHPDGREELVSTVDANAGMLHFQLLRHGMLDWATRGVYLGHARDYFAAHIDDVFFVNARWDPQTKVDRDESVTPIRMTAEDVLELEQWQERTGFPVELLFNGADVEEAPDDPLNRALLDRRDAFRWTNHTFDHALLGGTDRATMERSIVENLRFAERADVRLEPTELVTGAHSGLDDRTLAAALGATGIRWIGSDASYDRDQCGIGPALTVPRYPTGVYANVGRRAELLDEDDHLHRPPPHGICASASGPCRDAPIRWGEFVERETAAIFGRVVGNDPRPHFFHQSNLAEDRLFYPVIDAVLEMHRRYFRTPIDVPRMSTSGAILSRQSRWAAAMREGRVRAWRTGDAVAVEVDADLEVPVAFLEQWVVVKAGNVEKIAIARDEVI